MQYFSATYDPADNKLRLYSTSRLDSELYKRVKAAGFIWAPKQELFVAPAWTPEREDLLLELCEEIGDEDTSLIDRAEQRAERFEDYSDSRAKDAESARKAVAAIADNIPLGQPLLLGHHSYRHARKDAERIENGMRKAVKMWETSQYWESRAKGAILHAKYKERPDVRARRIKGLESDKRKQEKYKTTAETCLKLWTDKPLTHEQALLIAGRTEAGSLRLPRKEGDREDWSYTPTAYDALSGGYPNLYAPRTLDEVIECAKRVYPRHIAHCDRWINHLSNRIAYEKAMLGESGGTAADKFNLEVGGRVLIRDEWVVILKVNKVNGVVNSVTTNRRYVSKVAVENIKDYQAPDPEDAAKVKAATKLPPLTNFPSEGSKEITKAEWDNKHKDYKGTETKATETTGRYRYRVMIVTGHLTPVFITDIKRVDAPAKVETPISIPAPERAIPAPVYRTERTPNEFDAMKQTLKAGIQVVSAPQLFPTPPEIAEQMTDLAYLENGHTVLEPSAGTGRLIEAIRADQLDAKITAVEINYHLAEVLRQTVNDVRNTDFLECNGDLGKFDRVIMNPPFENAADIKHINHALTFLKPGGRLVALCANGPRQREQLMPKAAEWIDLPQGSFKSEGTNVNVAMAVFDN